MRRQKEDAMKSEAFEKKSKPRRNRPRGGQQPDQARLRDESKTRQARYDAPPDGEDEFGDEE